MGRYMCFQPRRKLRIPSLLTLAFIGVAAVGILVGGCGSSKGSTTDKPASKAEVKGLANELEEEVGAAQGEVLQECVARWNGPKNAGPRNEIVVLEASYLSVTISEIYSDKCLVTAANSNVNLAAQYLEVESAPYTFQQQASGEATSLPSTVTNWNASIGRGGYIALGLGSTVRE